MNTNQPFTVLLEHYAFAVATTFIQSASPTDQTRLIGLLNRINKASPTENALSTDQANECIQPPVDKNPLACLEQQWQAALTPTRVLKRGAGELRKPNLYRSIIINQQQIDTTTVAMQRMERLIERAKDTIHDPLVQTRLLNHYEDIQTTYATRLTQLMAFSKL